MLLSGRANFGRALNHASLLMVVSVEIERVWHLIDAEVLREGHMIGDSTSADAPASFTLIPLL